VREENEGEEIIRCHDLHTVETLIKVGIGRRERISSIRSVLRLVISVILPHGWICVVLVGQEEEHTQGH